MSKARKLSKAEQKRKEEFEKLTEFLIEQGYKPNHQTISALAGNVLGVLSAVPFAIIFFLLFSLDYENVEFTQLNFGLLLLLLIVFTVLHELIHGVTWAFLSKGGWKSISFGVILSYLTPYCTCNKPMKKYQMIIGSLMPTIILGFIPAIIACIINSYFLFIISVVMILCGGGDFLITFKLLLYKSSSEDTLFIDHPYELGTAVFEK
ncbi:MAG: DUF3267 domain-containing protein [Oscillospiraceae bacterium]|nr:DUF3267 domain-containing protein [Oscillospiraceae bacterium]MBQ5315464.1 DUF3267 domain-containing protein [Oscillospiraceae bacterium]